MVDPTTINKMLPQPVPGSDTDAWTSPYNSVFGITDNSFGGTAAIALAGANVVLGSSQSQCVFLQLTGALAANVSVTLPAVGSFYTVINDTTNSSAFTVTMVTTASGGRQIGVPPAVTDIMTDGTNVRFRSLPYVGSYWYHGGSSTPAWVSACSVAPWLYCNGTAFSSATYPSLTTILGTAATPDLRGRTPSFLNDGTGRLTASLTGAVDGNTKLAQGGQQVMTLLQAHLPNIEFPVGDPTHAHNITHNAITGQDLIQGGGFQGSYITLASISILANFTGVTFTSGGSNVPFGNLPPGIVAGITLIRAG